MRYQFAMLSMQASWPKGLKITEVTRIQSLPVELLWFELESVFRPVCCVVWI